MMDMLSGISRRRGKKMRKIADDQMQSKIKRRRKIFGMQRRGEKRVSYESQLQKYKKIKR